MRNVLGRCCLCSLQDTIHALDCTLKAKDPEHILF